VHDDLHRRAKILGQFTERHPPTTGQAPRQFAHRLSNGDTHRCHMVEGDPWFGFRSEEALDGCEEHRPKALGGDPSEHVGCEIDKRIFKSTGARQRFGCEPDPPFDLFRRLFERAVLKELREQQVPLFEQRQLFIEIDTFSIRQQSTKLQFDQRRSDQQELGRHLQIERFHPLELSQVRIDNGREADLVEVDLIPSDQVKQQIERPLEHRGGNGVRHGGPLYCPSVGHRPELGNTPAASQPAGSLSSPMTRVLSCIQPSGDITLGNYLGAIKHWVDDQSAESFHGVVDLHALTVQQDPAELRTQTVNTAMVLLAAGLDPAVTTVFVQSHVPEHAQLGWMMNCTVSYGELSRMTQFKDKSDKIGDQGFISAGLFTYPALMAADILLYDADEVPVGDDQRQHLEITRDIAQRFNSRYGDTFVVPKAAIPKVGARIMDLQDPTSKMSKSSESAQGIIYLLEDPKSIEKKVKRAMTDTDGEVRFDPTGKPGVSNLLSILAASTGGDPAALAANYSQYGSLKADAAAALVEFLRPVQQRYAELSANPDHVRSVLAAGADKAQAVASTVLKRAMDNIGLLAR
jgi:tryptophanyl-tRNA synthetase